MSEMDFQSTVIASLATIKSDVNYIKANNERVNSKLNSAHNKIRALEDNELRRFDNCPHTPTILELKRRHVTDQAVKNYVNKAVAKTAMVVSVLASIIGLIIRYIN